MKAVRSITTSLALALSALAPFVPARAEIVDEIIAWVNGDIVTRSEYEEEQKARTADLYRRFSGEELDREVERSRDELLLSIIDRKILLHHATALGYDMGKMGDAYLKMFRQQQGISSDEELRKLAEGDGMTVKQVRERLIELYAPADIVDMEVINRISVSDAEIESLYQENSAEFQIEGEVKLREIVLLADSQAARAERRAEAQAVLDRLQAGEDFGALATEVSEAGTAAVGGKIGPLKRGDLAESLVEPAFTLPVGDVSPLMETPYGFHIVKVESRIDDHLQALDDVRPAIRKQLEERKFRAELEVFMEKARAESEWCVKPKHQALLSIEAPPPCERL